MRKLDGYQQPPEGATRDQMGRFGGWISTYSGVPFWPMDARIEDVRTIDIAHALSNVCRFAGHCDRFYSVAEHSVRVARQVPYADRLWALLHDAPEAYLTDMPRPVKHTPEMQGYREAEARLMRVICRKYGLPFAQPESVTEADLVLLETERRDLHPRARWTEGVAPLALCITPWSPAYAKMMWSEALEFHLHERALVEAMD